MTGVKTNDPKVYAIAVPRSNNPARISGPIPSHKTYGPPTCAGRKGLDSHYPKESHNFMRRQAGAGARQIDWTVVLVTVQCKLTSRKPRCVMLWRSLILLSSASPGSAETG